VIEQSVSVSGIGDDVGSITTDLLTSTNNVEAAQYLRISEGNVAEVEVWAQVNGVLTNVALGATVTSDASIKTAYNSYDEVTLANVVDGDPGTSTQDTRGLQIDLGQAYVIERIVVVPQPNDGTSVTDTLRNVVISSSPVPFDEDTAGTVSGTFTAPGRGETIDVVWTDSYQTDDTTPAFTGTLGAALGTGEVLGVYNGDVRIGQALVTGTDWNFTPTALATGTHSLRFQVEDGTSGGVSSGRASSSVFTITVDDTAPTALANILTVTDDAGPVTGTIQPGNWTDDTRPTLTGTVNTSLSANQQVAVYDGTTFLGAADVIGTDWSFTPASPLSAGSHSLTAVVENIATGASGTASAAATFSIQQINVLGITDDVGLLQGNVLNQELVDGDLTLGVSQTNDTLVTLSGSFAEALQADQSLKVYDAGILLGTATVTGTDWSFDVPVLSYAYHSINVQIEENSAPSVALVSAELGINVVVDDPGFTDLRNASGLNVGGVDRALDLTLVNGEDQPALQTFNLDNIAGIESGQGTNTLILDIDDVLLSGTDLFTEANGYDGLLAEGRQQLRIDGASGTVDVEGSGWVAAGVTTDASGNDYLVYNYGTTAQLLIDTDLDRVGAVL
jgi:hypothetical protein